jgi:glycosyltransferase involved in cell wall biosynthesis
MKVAIWTNAPSPHQADFYAALRRAGVDLKVLYGEPLKRERRALGWSEPELLPAGEYRIEQPTQPFADLPDWKERIHILPGYCRVRYLRLARILSSHGAAWAHWSENSMPSWRSPLMLPLKRWYARQINRHALGAFAIGSHAEADFRRWGVRSEKIAHLYYAVAGVQPNCPLDREVRSFAAGRQAFVFVGTIDRNKSVYELVQAFGRTCQTARHCLVIVGHGPREEACRRLVSDLGLTEQVLFRGTVPIGEVGSVLKACQVLVLPSRYDGWGVVLNEAASAGLGLIASQAVGAGQHLIVPGWNGFRVTPGSVNSLAAAMQSYVRNPALAHIHGDNSKRLFQDFTPEKNTERFVASLQRWCTPRQEGLRIGRMADDTLANRRAA